MLLGWSVTAAARAANRNAASCCVLLTHIQVRWVPSVCPVMLLISCSQSGAEATSAAAHQLAAILLHHFLVPGLCSWQLLLHPVQAAELQGSRHGKPVDPQDGMASELLTGGSRGSDLLNHFLGSGDLGGVPCPWQGFPFTAPPWLPESPGAEQVGW